MVKDELCQAFLRFGSSKFHIFKLSVSHATLALAFTKTDLPLDSVSLLSLVLDQLDKIWAIFVRNVTVGQVENL